MPYYSCFKTDATFGPSSIISPLHNTSQRNTTVFHSQHMTTSYPHGVVYVIISYFLIDYILTVHNKVHQAALSANGKR